MASPTFTVLTTNEDVTDLSAYTTASISPSANADIVLAFIWSQRLGGGTPSIPSLSGGGVAPWDHHCNIISAGATRRLSVFKVDIVGTPAPSGVTITFSETQTNCAWLIIQVDNTLDADSALTTFNTGNGSGGSSSLSIGSKATTESRLLIATGLEAGCATWSGLTDETLLDFTSGSGVSLGAGFDPNGLDVTAGLSMCAGNNSSIILDVAGDTPPSIQSLPFFTTVDAKRI